MSRCDISCRELEVEVGLVVALVWGGAGGLIQLEKKGHFAISSFRSGLHVEMKVSICSRPSTSTAVYRGDGGELHSLILASSESSGLLHHA